jgi:hypothetical protein
LTDCTGAVPMRNRQGHGPVYREGGRVDPSRYTGRNRYLPDQQKGPEPGRLLLSGSYRNAGTTLRGPAIPDDVGRQSAAGSLVTIHESLRRVPDLITEEKIMQCIEITARALSVDFGIMRPKIAVAALNPHGGEQGMFGMEEQRIIEPAVRACPVEYGASGPWPPDTVFFRAAAGEYDAVVAMYHDQGLIPVQAPSFQGRSQCHPRPAHCQDFRGPRNRI